MANWPAAKLGDMVVGIDIHKVGFPFAPIPAPPPGVPMPHPYFGLLFLWLTPQFPKINVFINGVPACATGAMGYSCHVPFGIPYPPSMLNLDYFKRHLLNIPKQLVLVALTMFANMAIAKIAGIFVTPGSDTAAFVQDVTGSAISQQSSVTTSIKGGLSAYTKWQTWAKLLIPPLPFPGAQGSTAIGSPNVQVNGGPLGFVAPLMSVSCTEFIWVPNAATIGFSNVMVGVSLKAMARALLVHAAQVGVSKAVAAGVEKSGLGKAIDNLSESAADKLGKLFCGCK
jgi:hypothetical protein